MKKCNYLIKALSHTKLVIMSNVFRNWIGGQVNPGIHKRVLWRSHRLFNHCWALFSERQKLTRYHHPKIVGFTKGLRTVQ